MTKLDKVIAAAASLGFGYVDDTYFTTDIASIDLCDVSNELENNFGMNSFRNALHNAIKEHVEQELHETLNLI